ncbi:Fc receptor-like B isoform X3 [Panthera leo]|uniref:Fc receptor-like B isoform X3 n=1 Tax=Panthera leo TaxID=9689 RepID=UPI001C6A7DBA|nr:Fc receptor-like B isoform X3 [Panthera leo]
MWSLTALLLLVPSGGQAATLEKPVLSLHPPWTTIFKGERVTLRCDGYHPPLLELRPISTLWYLGHLLLPSHKKSIEVQTPGVYRCQTRGAPVSDPIHLSVSNDWLILQVPYAAVFEGEPLVMRCRGWYDKVVYKLHYYHDGKAVRYFHSSANYTVPQARASDSGRYQCSGTMRIPVESAPMFSAKVAVTVQEARHAAAVRLLQVQPPRAPLRLGRRVHGPRARGRGARIVLVRGRHRHAERPETQPLAAAPRARCRPGLGVHHRTSPTGRSLGARQPAAFLQKAPCVPIGRSGHLRPEHHLSRAAVPRGQSPHCWAPGLRPADALGAIGRRRPETRRGPSAPGNAAAQRPPEPGGAGTEGATGLPRARGHPWAPHFPLGCEPGNAGDRRRGELRAPWRAEGAGAPLSAPRAPSPAASPACHPQRPRQATSAGLRSFGGSFQEAP